MNPEQRFSAGDKIQQRTKRRMGNPLRVYGCFFCRNPHPLLSSPAGPAVHPNDRVENHRLKTSFKKASELVKRRIPTRIKRSPPTLVNTPMYRRVFWKAPRKVLRAKDKAKKGSPSPRE